MAGPTVYSVSEVTRQLKELVEANFPLVAVVGEISNCTKAGSGHVYLTLKDENAQLRAVIWRGVASRLKFDIEDGLEVVAVGPIEVYQARGTYQMIVEQLIPQGTGALELAFRQLQEKLSNEGLFEPEHKQLLPRFPKRIALVTSPTSAAVRDMLQVITRRWQAADIIILPVAVQGAGAAEEIAAAINYVPNIPNVDVIITGRGGGSLEDLWAFNEEVVARAIFDCPIPVISAVGHEIDLSISDLVADRRALTPSEAGELVVPLQEEIINQLNYWQELLSKSLKQKAAQSRLLLDSLADRRVFARPLERIHDLTAHLDELGDRIKRTMHNKLERSNGQLSSVAASLDALSPLKVLERGYSISQLESGEVVRSAKQLQPGYEMTTLFREGKITSRVEAVDADYDGFQVPDKT